MSFLSTAGRADAATKLPMGAVISPAIVNRNARRSFKFCEDATSFSVNTVHACRSQKRPPQQQRRRDTTDPAHRRLQLSRIMMSQVAIMPVIVMPVITVAGGHYPSLAEWALGNGEPVVPFPRFITELLTFPPRLTRAADFLWSVFSTVQGCGSGGAIR